METRFIMLIIMGVIVCICYFGIAFSIEEKKLTKGILSLFVMIFIALISLFINFVIINQNNELEKKLKGKCPEYKKIENVYQLKE